MREQRPSLTTDQLEALRAFASANGRAWKSKLRLAWETGRYDDYNGAEDTASLQQVRNSHGASWLAGFSLAEPYGKPYRSVANNRSRDPK